MEKSKIIVANDVNKINYNFPIHRLNQESIKIRTKGGKIWKVVGSIKFGEQTCCKLMIFFPYFFFFIKNLFKWRKGSFYKKKKQNKKQL